MKGRAGFTLAEALVALLLLGLLLQLGWAVAAAQQRGLRRLTERSEVLGAERAVWWVLSAETAAGAAGRDWSLAEEDVLALRAFRGRGVACSPAVDPDGWVAVRYRGWRLPDPVKDSVLTLDRAGHWTPRALAGRGEEAPPCPVREGERAERWRLEPPPTSPVVMARVFERGSYHLQDRAFRYRRGQGGRQPLTPEVVDPAGSGLAAAAGGGVEVRFRGARRSRVGASADPGWARVLRGGG